MKSLQEFIVHYQYSDWKKKLRKVQIELREILPDAIYKSHEVPLYWWLTVLFLLYLTPGIIVYRVIIYILK